MSPPAQNALPSPMRMATRVSREASIARAASRERLDHRAVERIELVGPLERDAGERPLEGQFDKRAHAAISAIGRSVRLIRAGWNSALSIVFRSGATRNGNSA